MQHYLIVTYALTHLTFYTHMLVITKKMENIYFLFCLVLYNWVWPAYANIQTHRIPMVKGKERKGTKLNRIQK